MIKAVILDVDGVIVGKKSGFNFPLPNSKILEEFDRLSKKGLPLILCTAKYYPAIREIVKSANLSNPHITDGGALIIDLLTGKIISKELVDKIPEKQIVEIALHNDIYLEVYTVDNYYVQKSQIRELTQKRATLLQQEPVIVDSLMDIVDKEIIKIIAFTKNEEEKGGFTKLFSPFDQKLNLLWSQHPFIAPSRLYIITSKKASKKLAAEKVIKDLNISFEEVLGVGDGLGDWEFMQLCKYAAAVGNAVDELKDLVKTKNQNGYIARDGVDDHGMLEILKHFSLA